MNKDREINEAINNLKTIFNQYYIFNSQTKKYVLKTNPSLTVEDVLRNFKRNGGIYNMTNIERIQNYTIQDLAEWIVDLIEEGERNLTVEEWKDWLIQKSIEN